VSEDLQLTVLGKSPAWQDADGACSGYLLRAGENALLDCGNGVISKLQKQLLPAQLDNVIISHLHADHFFDLVPLAYLFQFLPQPYGHPDRPPRLYLPDGGSEALTNISKIWNAPTMFTDNFEIIEYQPGDSWQLGDTVVETVEVPHYVTTSAFAFTSASGARLVYGADCGPNPQLIELANDADLLIAEATMPVGEEIEGHLTAVQAGEHAAAASAKRLMLTHFSELFQSGQLCEQVKSSYSGELLLAAEGLKISL